MTKLRTIGLGLPMVCVVSCALVGCMSLAEMAPPVDDARTLAIATTYGGQPDTLQRGRHLYITQCNGCHSVEPIERYPLAQWEIILPEMSSEAGLDPAQTGALTHYVMTIRRMQDAGALADASGL